MDYKCTIDNLHCELELILGDEVGYIRFLNLNAILTECSIKPFVSQQENRNLKRMNEVIIILLKGFKYDFIVLVCF